MALQSVGIVGGGAWGTALAITAHRAGRDVLIWAYEAQTVADINRKHRNEVYLPGIKLDPAIEATARFNEVANCDMLLMVTPAQQVRGIAGELAPYVKPGQPVVINPGLEHGATIHVIGSGNQFAHAPRCRGAIPGPPCMAMVD